MSCIRFLPLSVERLFLHKRRSLGRVSKTHTVYDGTGSENLFKLNSSLHCIFFSSAHRDAARSSHHPQPRIEPIIDRHAMSFTHDASTSKQTLFDAPSRHDARWPARSTIARIAPHTLTIKT
jgi:hypothetical protein